MRNRSLTMSKIRREHHFRKLNPEYNSADVILAEYDLQLRAEVFQQGRGSSRGGRPIKDDGMFCKLMSISSGRQSVVTPKFHTPPSPSSPQIRLHPSTALCTNRFHSYFPSGYLAFPAFSTSLGECTIVPPPISCRK
ncbi:hypothetical protein J6590_077558 [Homalodisca vitripennis]|nr:hypothetical protein J6590_077558 [Homalodisca vitripennis]